MQRADTKQVLAALLRQGRRDLAETFVREWRSKTRVHAQANATASINDEFDVRMKELQQQQRKRAKKLVGIDGDRRVTNEIDVSQSLPGKVWSFVYTSTGLEVVSVRGVRRARKVRDVLQRANTKDFQKLRELAFKWIKENPR
jgi:hypothetical protein